jgi:hypothetical protein
MTILPARKLFQYKCALSRLSVFKTSRNWSFWPVFLDSLYDHWIRFGYESLESLAGTPKGGRSRQRSHSVNYSASGENIKPSFI